MIKSKSIDLPRNLYHQIKQGGLLLIVIKNEGGGDNLFLLEKKANILNRLIQHLVDLLR